MQIIDVLHPGKANVSKVIFLVFFFSGFLGYSCVMCFYKVICQVLMLNLVIHMLSLCRLS